MERNPEKNESESDDTNASSTPPRSAVKSRGSTSQETPPEKKIKMKEGMDSKAETIPSSGEKEDGAGLSSARRSLEIPETFGTPPEESPVSHVIMTRGQYEWKKNQGMDSETETIPSSGERDDGAGPSSARQPLQIPGTLETPPEDSSVSQGMDSKAETIPSSGEGDDGAGPSSARESLEIPETYGTPPEESPVLQSSEEKLEYIMSSMIVKNIISDLGVSEDIEKSLNTKSPIDDSGPSQVHVSPSKKMKDKEDPKPKKRYTKKRTLAPKEQGSSSEEVDPETDLTIGIERKDGRPISYKESKYLRRNLYLVFFSYYNARRASEPPLVESENGGPQIEVDYLCDSGAFKMICSNDETHHWVANLKFPVELGHYEVVLKDRKKKLVFYLPRQGRDFDPKSAVEIMKWQNDGLHPEKWKIHGHYNSENGTDLIIYVDQDSYKVIKKRRWNICYKIHNIYIKHFY